MWRQLCRRGVQEHFLHRDLVNGRFIGIQANQQRRPPPRSVKKAHQRNERKGRPSHSFAVKRGLVVGTFQQLEAIS